MGRETEPPAVETQLDRPPACEQTQTAPPWVSAGTARGLSPAHVMALQRGAGNQAAGRAIAMAGRPPATAARRTGGAGRGSWKRSGPAGGPENAAAPATHAQQGAGAADPALEFIAGDLMPNARIHAARPRGSDRTRSRERALGGEGSLLREVVKLVPGGAELMQRLQQSGAVDRKRAPGCARRSRGSGSPTVNDLLALRARLGQPLRLGPDRPGRGLERHCQASSPRRSSPRDRLRGARRREALELSLEAMIAAGGGATAQVLGILRRAGEAFGTIVRDPLGFASNLVAAVRAASGVRRPTSAPTWSAAFSAG